MPYSPHPSEIYDGITTIDKDGINVSTSYGAHTQFHAGGMSSYNNSNQRSLGIENGGISFHAWNNNGSGWGNCGLNMQVTLDKPYYRFPNGKQYIDTRTGWQYFHLRTDGFGGTDKPIKHGAWHSYGPGTIWREDAIVAHIWVSLPIYLNTSSVEL